MKFSSVIPTFAKYRRNSIDNDIANNFLPIRELIIEITQNTQQFQNRTHKNYTQLYQVDEMR